MAFAQQEQKVAVYVTGNFGANEKKALGNKMLSSFIKSGFKAIENENAFLAQIQEPADNRQISGAGKAAGARYVCIADITPVLGSYQVSARLIDVETATITNMGEASSPLRTIDDMGVASDKVVASMFGLLQPVAYVPPQPQQPVVYAQPQAQPQPQQPVVYAQPQAQPQPQQPVVYAQPQAQPVAQPQPAAAQPIAVPEALQGYGVRVSIGLNSFSTGDSKHDKDLDMGFGFGIGALYKSIPIMPAMTFNPELSFLYRKLYSMSYSDDDYESEEDVSEFALSSALLVQYVPVAGMPLYVTAGLQIDLPFSSETKWEETDKNYDETESGSDKYKDRRTLDFGIAFGAGYHVSEKIRADFRAVIGLTSLTGKDKDETSFNQYGLGVAYFF
jgi:hypothetical protein